MTGRHNGWTLVELMVALTIAAILLSIAYPAYTEQVRKSRRADGHALLFTAAQREQQFFTVNNQFTDTIGTGGLELSASSQEGYYTLSITATTNTYTLTATREAPQTGDTRCGDLTLNHLGVKGNSGGSLSPERCW